MKVEIEGTEETVRIVEGELDYIMQVKDGYKFELGVYLKQLFEGTLPIDYYKFSLVHYLTLMKKIKFTSYEFGYWEGLDKIDVKYIKKMAECASKLAEMNGGKKNFRINRNENMKNAGYVLKILNNKNTHFSLVGNLKIPNIKEVQDKIKDIRKKDHIGDILLKKSEEDKSKKYLKYYQNTDSEEEEEEESNIIDEKIEEELNKEKENEKLIEATVDSNVSIKRKALLKFDKKKGFIIPSLEIKKEVEKLEKSQEEKITREMSQIIGIEGTKYHKKLVMLYGIEKSNEFIHTFKLMQKFK